MAEGGDRRCRETRPAGSETDPRSVGARDPGVARRRFQRRRVSQSSVGSRQSSVDGSAATMMTIEQFGRRLRARELTSVRATEECLRKIEADNPKLNAFITVTADEALRQAREADQELAAGTDRGPPRGVPICLKDLLDGRGVPTTAASRVREGHVAERDAPTVVHLRQAGAVFVG